MARLCGVLQTEGNNTGACAERSQGAVDGGFTSETSTQGSYINLDLGDHRRGWCENHVVILTRRTCASHRASAAFMSLSCWSKDARTTTPREATAGLRGLAGRIAIPVGLTAKLCWYVALCVDTHTRTQRVAWTLIYTKTVHESGMKRIQNFTLLECAV